MCAAIDVFLFTPLPLPVLTIPYPVQSVMALPLANMEFFPPAVKGNVRGKPLQRAV
jgi:hypothetical protein